MNDGPFNVWEKAAIGAVLGALLAYSIIKLFQHWALS